jgi:hypothetical protein
MNPADRENWRLAFIESFREWGISPRGIRSMAEDSLLWPTERQVIEEREKVAKGFGRAELHGCARAWKGRHEENVPAKGSRRIR